MPTLAKYVNAKTKAGRFPMVLIQPGENGTFWLHDADFNMLDCPAFMSRESAENARSKAIAIATKRFA